MIHDIGGVRFGRLVALRLDGVVSGRARWAVRCDCGAEALVLAQSLKSGATRSCGCLAAESNRCKGKNASHGASKSPEYEAWIGMKRRCNRPTDGAFPRYGGRGIRVCDRWASSFVAFLSDMGPAPQGMEIDRIDVDGHYEPGNCRWATLHQQANNKRNNRMVGGLTVAEVAQLEGVSYSTAYWRHVVRDRAPTRAEQRAAIGAQP